jgi:DNA-binding response OmpR family regulator
MTDEIKPSRDPLPWFPDAELESELSSLPIHILVADDDDATRTLLERALQNLGYRVTATADGARAWEALSDLDDVPQLAILDWMMPFVDGPELCRRLKARGQPFVFTILLTARTSENDVVVGLEAGAHEFLSKPFDIHVLGARVAAGARIVRLEQKLTIKSEVLKEYAEKLERLSRDRVK